MEQRQHAMSLLNRVWMQVLKRGGFCPTDLYWEHIQSAFPTDLITALSLPLESKSNDDQVITLVQQVDLKTKFDYYLKDLMLMEYKRQPRTQIYENIHEHAPWAGIVSSKLSELTGSRVVCRAFLSRPDDEKPQEHVDAWFGLIIQLHGVKRWRLRLNKSDKHTVIDTYPGDLLIISEGVLHEVETPHLVQGEVDNNYSLHAQFAVLSENSISA